MSDIIESPDQRAALVKRIDVLDRAGELETVPGKEFVTTAMVARFYNVPRQAIDSTVHDNRAELESNGFRVIRGSELRSLKADFPEGSPFKQANAVALWDRRAVLLLGMLLRDSEVAKRVRAYLLDTEEKVSQAAIQHTETGVPAEARYDFSEIDRLVSANVELAKANADMVREVTRLLKGGNATPEPVAVEVSASDFAAFCGIPEVVNGKRLYFGARGRNGKPWARYGMGKAAEWLPREFVAKKFGEMTNVAG